MREEGSQGTYCTIDSNQYLDQWPRLFSYVWCV